MRIPEIRSKGINTTGLTGIVLMTLHILGHLNGWAWPILYVILIMSGIGQEYYKKKDI
jgi:hypothetical protein|tara:strand:- start:2481 stop:2654 length:174 start_codon:yes stop_codon:yes gene_type:complete